MPSINWTDALESADKIEDFKVLPKGAYIFTVAKAEHKVASTGKDMFALTCKVQDGAHKGRNVFTNLVISPNSGVAMGMFFKKCAALGLNEEYFRTSPDNDAVANAMLDRTFKGTVDIRTYQGTERNDITNMAPAVGVQGGSAAAPPPPSPTPSAAATPPPPPAPASSEVPF